MSNYSVLKQDINNNIYENQTQQITGTVLNAILNEMTASLGAGYQFAGVATLGMNPGDPDQRVFYLAGEGIYTSFGGIQVPAGKLGVLKWDNRWTLQTIDGLGGGGANLTGYVTVASTDDLPDEGVATLGYLCGTNLYLYVGEGGDTKEGKYQDCGSFRGPEGAYIQDIEQTETSHENGGRNTIKMTLSDGRSFNAYVHNGTTSSGLFPTLAALQAAYPTPVVGQYAFVGSGFPADIYVCTTAGTWTDSGEDYDGDNVDLTDYATKAEVNQLEAELNEKADQAEVSQLQHEVTESYGDYVEDDTWIWVVTDADRKILAGIKADGAVEWSVGVPTPIQAELNEKVDKENGKSLINSDYSNSLSTIESDTFLQVVTDSNDRIVEGIKTDGTKVLNGGVELGGARHDNVENPEWLHVILDEENKVIAGIDKHGKLHAQLAGNSSVGGVVEIPILNETFTSALPFSVYNGDVLDNSVKGTENAKYIFDLPVGDSWIVRFKFRITENLLNENKDAEIASINGAKVTAKVFPLTQHQEEYTYEGVSHTENWPTTDGGIAFNRNTMNNFVYGRNLGQQAFSVRYVGNGSTVTLENTGTALVLTVDGSQTSYSFNNYDDVSELFAALSDNTDLELQYIALDCRTCDELAKFGAVVLKDTFYTDTRGAGSNAYLAPHIDNAPFYIYYAVSEKWHQVEIFKIGETIYSACDGNVVTNTVIGNDGTLILGGDCKVLFKDFVFCGDGTLDTEYINGMLVSSASPYILIFEAHGMYDGPAYTVTPAESDNGMSSLNPDTLEHFFSILDKKGYVPVSIDEVAEYYTSGTPLPKRCYVHTFDDERWPIALDLRFRSGYRKHGAKPSLVLVTASPNAIYYNGEEITKDKAAEITKNAGFSIVSHTARHRNIPRSCMPSQYIEFFNGDIYDGDEHNVDASILVYPGGQSNVYSHDVMEYLGFRLGIEITNNNGISNLSHTRFNLSRVNIGRIIYANGSFVNYAEYENKII